MVSACPCDFSVDAYLALDVDPDTQCYFDEPGLGTVVGNPFLDDFVLQLDDSGCFTVDNGELIDPNEYTNPQQPEACRTALLAIAGALNIPLCNN